MDISERTKALESLKIGTRESKLALLQSNWVKARIEQEYPNTRIELVAIRTTGDKILDSPLSKVGGKGLFVKEIEAALLNGEVDLAVHSVKDVPADLPKGLVLAIFPEREDPRDAFISIQCRAFNALPHGSRVGTSSLRRTAQLLNARPDLEVISLRGNVDTRLRKLAAGEFQAIVLATAGLKRFGLTDRISEVFSTEQMLPAIGQGALGLELRADDTEAIDLLSFLNHEPTKITVEAERAFLKELEGGCQVPIAAFAQLNDERLELRGMVAELDGSRLLTDCLTGNKNDGENIGIKLARALLDAGADKILAEVYGTDESPDGERGDSGPR
jgi:hydroxymethylbilane synthase